MDALIKFGAYIWFPLVVAFSVVFCLFLYFRAGRRELYEKEPLFDFAFWLVLGGFLGGRLLDFLIRSDYFGWSIKRLIFFNVYGGFNIWGALAGGLILGFIVALRPKRFNFWQLLDFFAAPIFLGMAVIDLSLFLREKVPVFALYSAIYFILFWILKRFEKIKRHNGFFACLFVVGVSLVSLGLYPLREKTQVIYGIFTYQLVLPLLFLVLFAIIWYVLSKRKIRKDLKSLSGAFLLLLFATKRVLTSVGEANNFAKSIVLLPLHLSKSIYFLVLLIGREMRGSFADLGSALGIRK